MNPLEIQITPLMLGILSQAIVGITAAYAIFAYSRKSLVIWISTLFTVQGTVLGLLLTNLHIAAYAYPLQHLPGRLYVVSEFWTLMTLLALVYFFPAPNPRFEIEAKKSIRLTLTLLSVLTLFQLIFVPAPDKERLFQAGYLITYGVFLLFLLIISARRFIYERNMQNGSAGLASGALTVLILLLATNNVINVVPFFSGEATPFSVYSPLIAVLMAVVAAWIYMRYAGERTQTIGLLIIAIVMIIAIIISVSGFWIEARILASYVEMPGAPSSAELVNQQLQPLAAVLVLAALSIIVGAPYILTPVIMRPLRVLVSGTQHVGSGNFETRLPQYHDDEIGLLTSSFNQMVHSIQQSQFTLQELNETLEQRVVARTSELSEAKNAAEQATLAKSRFIAQMSHELRTPLNAIIGFAQLLENSYPDVHYAATIRDSGHHLLGLVSDVLDIARGDVDQIKLRPNMFNLPKMLRHVVDTMSLPAGRKQLAFRFSAGELPTMVFADAQRLRQVLINLLNNAIKFTREGEISFEVEAVSQSHTMTEVKFCVTDTGIGIEAEQIEAIFEPFQQTNDGTQYVDGAGLGLAISEQLVRLMDSELQVESTMGKGSRFWFTVSLPMAAVVFNVPEENLQVNKSLSDRRVTLPSPEIMERISGAARIGDVIAIESEITGLTGHERYQPFVERVTFYVEAYQMKSLRQWLKEQDLAQQAAVSIKRGKIV